MKKGDIEIEEGVLRSILYGQVPFSRFMNLCSFQPNGYQFSKKYQAGVWDGKIRLAKYVKGRLTFPSGLMDRVKEWLIKEGFTPIIKRTYDVDKLTSKDIRPLKKATLRDYQIEALKMVLYHRRGIIKLPTASGKTLLAAGIIKTVRKPALFLTHKKDLLYQTAKVFKKEIGTKYVGIIGDQIWEPNIITVASIPTIHNKVDKLRDHLQTKHVMIADEVHHAIANTWFHLMQEIPTYYRIGLTATPIVGQGKILLEASTGPIIYTAPPKKLIDEGWLSRPTIKMIYIKKEKLEERTDYHTAYSEGIAHSEYRNKHIVKICKHIKKHHEKLLPIVIQVRLISHLHYLKQLFQSTKLKCEVLDGSDKATIRIKSFENVERTKLDVLLVSTIFDEGVDVQNVRTLIIGSGGKSDIRTIQRLGRGMRRTKTKSKVLVVDFYDKTHDYLERHSKARLKTYKREGYNVKRTKYKTLKKRLEDW